MLTSGLDFSRYSPRIYIISEGDTLSASKAISLEHSKASRSPPITVSSRHSFEFVSASSWCCSGKRCPGELQDFGHSPRSARAPSPTDRSSDIHAFRLGLHISSDDCSATPGRLVWDTHRGPVDTEWSRNMCYALCRRYGE